MAIPTFKPSSTYGIHTVSFLSSERLLTYTEHRSRQHRMCTELCYLSDHTYIHSCQVTDYSLDLYGAQVELIDYSIECALNYATYQTIISIPVK